MIPRGVHAWLSTSNALNKNDKILLVSGGLATLLTFFPWFYTVSFDGGDLAPGLSASEGITPWHELGFIGSLLILAAT